MLSVYVYTYNTDVMELDLRESPLRYFKGLSFGPEHEMTYSWSLSVNKVRVFVRTDWTCLILMPRLVFIHILRKRLELLGFDPGVVAESAQIAL